MCISPLQVNGKRPKYINGQWTNRFYVSCGKCYQCKQDRVREWCFRLKVDERHSFSSYFITLTYNQENVPRTKNNFKTLSKKDVTHFLKRLWKLEKKTYKKENISQEKKAKIYLVGEYGTITQRPHYHMIILNLLSLDNIYKAWTKEIPGTKERASLGSIHVGQVTGDSIAYTLKYLDKPSKIPKHKYDDRVKEFQRTSKGIGDSYLNNAIKKYHKEDLTRYYVNDGKFKVKMPRYYSDRIYTDDELIMISKHVHDYHQINKEKIRLYLYSKLKRNITDSDLELYKDMVIQGQNYSFNKNTIRDV